MSLLITAFHSSVSVFRLIALFTIFFKTYMLLLLFLNIIFFIICFRAMTVNRNDFFIKSRYIKKENMGF